MQLQPFVFNLFSENTYVLYNEQKNAWLFDPGNFTENETAILENFIAEKDLKIKKILLTHAHIDHVLGLEWAAKKFEAPVYLHEEDEILLEMFPMSAARFGITLPPINVKTTRISEGDELDFDGEKFKIYHVPGHSPGSIVFYNESQKFMISGDVLFQGSIGRTDLYKGNHEQLLDGIRKKLFVLDPETQVFSGHGNPTTIGFEKDYNPFFVLKK